MSEQPKMVELRFIFKRTENIERYIAQKKKQISHSRKEMEWSDLRGFSISISLYK